MIKQSHRYSVENSKAARFFHHSWRSGSLLLIYALTNVSPCFFYSLSPRNVGKAISCWRERNGYSFFDFRCMYSMIDTFKKKLSMVQFYYLFSLSKYESFIVESLWISHFILIHISNWTFEIDYSVFTLIHFLNCIENFHRAEIHHVFS